MEVIRCRNVNDALPRGLALLGAIGVRRDSRNGPVLVAPCPVTTVYERPRERVLMDPARDANPFFHLVEALWMLSGRSDVKTVATYVSRMRTYSDDGRTLHGAYGRRWRGWFPIVDGQGKRSGVVDQLAWVANRLAGNPDDRRCVIQMWDASIDPVVAELGGKDVPCNTQIYVSVGVDGRLDMTVTCRSNDAIWGAHGANSVHFSFLQEYIARSLGREVGVLYQVSNNYHAYLSVLEPLVAEQRPSQPYEWDGFVDAQPIFEGSAREFDEDVAMLLDEDVSLGLRSNWLRRVAVPVILAHRQYRDKRDPQRHEKALEIIAQCRAADWRAACTQWLERRLEKARRAADDGVQHDE